MKRYFAKKDTWYDEGTECFLEDHIDDSTGSFHGWRTCEEDGFECGRKKGERYWDGEVCGYWEFEIVEE